MEQTNEQAENEQAENCVTEAMQKKDDDVKPLRPQSFHINIRIPGAMPRL